METNHQLALIMRIMKKVRKEAEEIAANNSFFPSDLCGMCARASAMLHEALKNVGVKTVFAANDDHVFLLYGGRNGYILDITASQFGKSDILIAPVKSLKSTKYMEDWWRVHIVINSVFELEKMQEDNDWPIEQRVSAH